MLGTHHRTQIEHHRSLLHPHRGVWTVPIEHISGSVPVSVSTPAKEPESQPTPEWLTDAWKYRVEAEALHRLEDSLRGLGSVH